MSKSINRAVPTLQEGQLWELADSRILISTVGKTLVHYKQIPLGAKRGKVSLVSKTALAAYLKDNGASQLRRRAR